MLHNTGMHGDISTLIDRLFNRSLHCNHCSLLVMKQRTTATPISMFQNSCHMFNFNCGFNHVNHMA